MQSYAAVREQMGHKASWHLGLPKRPPHPEAHSSGGQEPCGSKAWGASLPSAENWD